VRVRACVGVRRDGASRNVDMCALVSQGTSRPRRTYIGLLHLYQAEAGKEIAIIL